MNQSEMLERVRIVAGKVQVWSEFMEIMFTDADAEAMRAAVVILERLQENGKDRKIPATKTESPPVAPVPDIAPVPGYDAAMIDETFDRR